MATVCPQTGHGSDVLSNLVVCPSLVIGEQICCSQVGSAFTYTDVSIHNSSGMILALITNLYSTEYFLLCQYLKICMKKQLPTVVKCLWGSLRTPGLLQGYNSEYRNNSQTTLWDLAESQLHPGSCMIYILFWLGFAAAARDNVQHSKSSRFWTCM